MTKYLDMTGVKKLVEWIKSNFGKVQTGSCISTDSEGYLNVKFDTLSITQNVSNELTLAKSCTEVVDTAGIAYDRVALNLTAGKAVWDVTSTKHTITGTSVDGSFLTDKHYAQPEQTVTIHNIPNSNYAFKDISVVPLTVTLTQTSTNTWTFTMPDSDVGITINNIYKGADTGKMYLYRPSHSSVAYICNEYRSGATDISQALHGGSLYPLTYGYYISFIEPVYPTSIADWFANSDYKTITGLEYVHTTNCTDMSSAFENCKAISVDISSWDFSKVKTTKNMFSNCTSSITMPDYLNLTSCSDMTSMFEGSKLITCNLMGMGSFSKLNSLSSTFKNCTSLTGVFFPEQCNIKALDASNAFYGCTSLNSIFCNDDLSTTKGMGNSKGMFYNCVNLPSYSASNPTDKTLAKPQSLGGYFDVY